MKMMNVLDMSGNQIQNALVHNGNVTGEGTQLTAAAGSFAYNEADRSLYYGYDNSTDGNGRDLRWSRLVDVAHLGDALSGDAVYKWAKVVSESNVKIDKNTFTLGATAVVNLLEQGGNAYSWGDHNKQNYAKSFTARKFEDDEDNIYPGETLTKELFDSMGRFPMAEVVFDEEEQTLYLHVTAIYWKGKEGIFELFFEDWDSLGGIPSLDDHYGEGYILAIEDTGDTYFCTPSGAQDWVKFANANATEWVETVRKSFTATELVNTVNTAYGWGNHADAGYTKVYKIDKAVEADMRPIQGNTYNDLLGLQQGTGKNDWTQHEVVFDTATLSLLCEYTRLEGDDTVSAYVKAWNGFNTINDASFYEVNGNLLFVKGNASVYKYENSQWVLYLSGASQDVIQKIDAIKNALGIGDDYQDPTPDIIDTWNEMKAYFANIDDKDQSLLNLIASKANDADVVKKPSTAVNGEMLVIDNGNPTWKARKIVVSNIDHVGFSGLDWEVDISELETIDVNITLYMKNATGRYEVILADISVNETQRGSGVRRSVVIEFGADMTDKELKLVITA